MLDRIEPSSLINDELKIQLKNQFKMYFVWMPATEIRVLTNAIFWLDNILTTKMFPSFVFN